MAEPSVREYLLLASAMRMLTLPSIRQYMLNHLQQHSQCYCCALVCLSTQPMFARVADDACAVDIHSLIASHRHCIIALPLSLSVQNNATPQRDDQSIEMRHKHASCLGLQHLQAMAGHALPIATERCCCASPSSMRRQRQQTLYHRQSR